MGRALRGYLLIASVVSVFTASLVFTLCSCFAIRGMAQPAEDIRYGQPMAEILDPREGYVKQTILAPTDGILFFAHKEALVSQHDIIYRLIHRLHE